MTSGIFQQMGKKNTVLILGQIPPPFIGPNIATEVLLGSTLNDKFQLTHFDFSDHRDLRTLGRIDFMNIILALKHYVRLFFLLFLRRPELVYLPICQTTIGYLRDLGFIIICKLFGSKVICHLRGGDFRNWHERSSIVTRWIVRRFHPLVDGQIVLGAKLRILFDGLLPPQKVFVVPNGRDFKFSRTRTPQRDKLTILYFANFIPTKGIFETLEATQRVFRQYPNIQFFAAGKYSKEIGIKIEDILSSGPALPVHLFGPVFNNEKFELFLTSDIFVFPTYYPAEGHPWVIVEAMAAGLPIITTDQGAITESVKDGVNGFIVEKKNPRQIAEKIKFLIENPEIRKRMGEESRRLYLENFTEEKMVERLSFVFNSVLAS